MKKTQATNIDEYIAEFPKDIQKKLKEMRAIIRKAAPKAEEAIKYAIPTFVQENGNVVHFAGYKNHIGFYPAPRALEAFKEALADYEGSKGSLQLPLDKPIPSGLITKIVKFRLKEMEEKVKAKSVKPKKK